MGASTVVWWALVERGLHLEVVLLDGLDDFVVVECGAVVVVEA